MAQDNQGLQTHILPGWVFPQQFLDINSVYFGLYRRVYRGNQFNDVTLYAHENFHFHIWGSSPKIIELKKPTF